MDHTEDLYLIEDINAQYNTITLDDDPFEIKQKRESAFINLSWNRLVTDSHDLYDFSHSNLAPSSMIRGYLIQLDEVGKSYTRQVKKATDVLTELGGIGKSVGVAFIVL